ncbi:hypothetical protein HK098_002516 [Nowakowskiella sp. JEL0407]|nr:hypothetical protein HK098_002516 [Nowakowskiella sp. JEL0407]
MFKVTSILTLAWILVTSTPTNAQIPSNPLVYWTDVIVNAVGSATPSYTSPIADRNLAVVYGSIWEATLAADVVIGNLSATSHPEIYQKATISYAAHDALSRLYPGGLRTFSTALEDYIGSLTARGNFADDLIKAQFAESAATKKMFSSRLSDASGEYVLYNTTGTKNSGPPGPPVNPGARYIKPFILASVSQNFIPPPPALNSDEYLGNVTELNNLGQATSNRTAYDTITAFYWADSTPIRFKKILRILIANSDFTVRKSAHTFALMNYAMVNTAISAWDAKYQYNVWRPITLFRHKGTFSKNNITVTNKSWTPQLNTPDHPEYISGHSSIGRAAVTRKHNIGVVTRQYTSLNNIAEENGRS